MSEGRIEALWRFPVLGMRGEPLRSAQVGTRGVAGDGQHHAAGPEGRLGADDLPGLARWSAAFPFTPDGALLPDRPAPFPLLTEPTGTRSWRWGDPRLASALARDLGRTVELARAPDATRGVIVSTEGAVDAASGINVGLRLPPPTGGWAGRELRFEGGVRLRLISSRADGPGIEARVVRAGRLALGERVELG